MEPLRYLKLTMLGVAQYPLHYHVRSSSITVSYQEPSSFNTPSAISELMSDVSDAYAANLVGGVRVMNAC